MEFHDVTAMSGVRFISFTFSKYLLPGISRGYFFFFSSNPLVTRHESFLPLVTGQWSQLKLIP